MKKQALKLSPKHTSPAWAEINLSALLHNYGQLKKASGNREIIPMIKANAYGHGAPAVAAFLAKKAGVTKLGVARVNEGVELRRCGIAKENIIIFGGFNPAEIPDILKYRLEPSVFTESSVAALAIAAKRAGKTVKVHIKINTGMNRLGIRPDSALALINRIKKQKTLKIASYYTHLADSDMKNDRRTRKQCEALALAVVSAGRTGTEYMHAANSAAIVRYPFARFDAVRPGIMLYGSAPEKWLMKKISLKPVMSFKASVVNVIALKRGDAVSYGGTYKAKKNEKIAIIAAGYGDGLRRSLSGKWDVILNGRKARIAGRVCMDLTAVKVSGNVKTGDTAVIFGNKNAAVEDMAEMCGTIPYEIMTGITARVERIYKV